MRCKDNRREYGANLDIIEYIDEERPAWNNEQFYWMAVCDFITAHWYFILTMDEYASLFQLKYPEVDTKTIRDAYVFQVYSELDYRGREEFNDVEKRDTLLTPIVIDEKEYLVTNKIELQDDPDRMISKVLAAHGDKKMYMPTVQEMEEFLNLRFNPSNEEVMRAFERLTELVYIKNSVVKGRFNDEGEPIDENGKVDEAAEREYRERDKIAQTAVCNAILGFENGVSLEEVCRQIFDKLPLIKDFEVIEQFLRIFNNTHLPGNKGYTPLQLDKLKKGQKRDYGRSGRRR